MTSVDQENVIEGWVIRVRGLVQGVGFRPTVWRLALDRALVGEVINDGEGVLIRVWGTAQNLKAFQNDLKIKSPPLSRVDSIETSRLNTPSKSDVFTIADSRDQPMRTSVGPDAATCPKCRSDIFDPDNRRFGYPFTNCTHCGPRLSIIEAIPYDRANTSMAMFSMCKSCRNEYDLPSDRRFHAQPNACSECGPRLWLENENGEIIDGDAIAVTADFIKDGKIVAIKGIGGFHLACDAMNGAAVARLRERKYRYDKPFALMARDNAMVQAFAYLSPTEEALLEHKAAPIVVLDRKDGVYQLPKQIAPGQDGLGFMLPYTPLHHLLMAALDGPIILTSGNRSGEPQSIDNDDARERLNGIADVWLMHDRHIVNRLDDSVLREMGGATRMLRRARGFVPEPVKLPEYFSSAPSVLAMGGELKTTFCLVKDGEAILSQHIGDMKDIAVHEDYRRTLDLFCNLYEFSPELVATDLHPDYLSTQWGVRISDEHGLPISQVQHHHAHIAACLAENGVSPEEGAVLGIALDGVGLGADASLWGGEFLKADYWGFERVAHFTPIPLPGGEAATREPWRNTYAQIASLLGWKWVESNYPNLDLTRFLQKKPLHKLDVLMDRSLNAPLSSSAGRLFDAAAAAIGICADAVNYEGQAAIELEALAKKSERQEKQHYNYHLSKTKTIFVDWTQMWRDILHDLDAEIEPSRIAVRFHNTIITAVVELAGLLAKQEGIDKVVLSGGVFNNRLLFEGISERLKVQKLQVLSHRLVPAGDGGLSLGQAVVAAARYIRDGGEKFL